MRQQSDWFLMVGVAGVSLVASDIARLNHPRAGAVLLFARNYQDRQQLALLTQQIKAVKPLPIFVDQEGGLIQRFQNGFTRLPSMRVLGMHYAQAEEAGLALAEACGCVMAYELVECGVDCSFAPVVDLDYGNSTVIDSRSFSSDPHTVTVLAAALRKGMNSVGMSAVIKHFPGHGYVHADSHLEMPIDYRSLSDFVEADLIPFQQFSTAKIEGVMVAHLTVPEFDSDSAGFSRKWLDYLRQELGFEGVIFSDDMSMHAVTHLTLSERIQKAASAGCQGIICANDNTALDAYISTAQIESETLTFNESAWLCRPSSRKRSYYEACRALIERL